MYSRLNKHLYYYKIVIVITIIIVIITIILQPHKANLKKNVCICIIIDLKKYIDKDLHYEFKYVIYCRFCINAGIAFMES